MTPRLPVYILVDRSGSMAGEPIEAAEAFLRASFSALSGNPFAVGRLHLSVITFDAVVRVEFPLTPVSLAVPPSLTVGSGSSLGAAMDLVLERVGAEAAEGDSKPLVFILTDGRPTDEWRGPAARLRSVRPHTVAIFGVGIGDDVDFGTLARIADVCVHNKSLSPENLTRLYVWLGAGEEQRNKPLSLLKPPLTASEASGGPPTRPTGPLDSKNTLAADWPPTRSAIIPAPLVGPPPTRPAGPLSISTPSWAPPSSPNAPSVPPAPLAGLTSTQPVPRSASDFVPLVPPPAPIPLPDIEDYSFSRDAPVIRLTLKTVSKSNGAPGLDIDGQIKYLDSQIGPLMYKSNKPAEMHIRLTKDFLYEGIEINKFFSDTLKFRASWEEGKVVIRSSKPEAYDGPLNIIYYISNYGNGQHKKLKKLTKNFHIAPDPRNLWLSLPVKDHEGYELSDSDQASEPVKDFGKVVTAASCRGRLHAHEAKPRDDNFRYKLDPESGWNLFAVADGAGSAKYSRKGSEIACVSAVEGLHGLLSQGAVADLFSQNHDMLVEWKKSAAAMTREREEGFRAALKLDPVVYNVVYNTYVKIVEEAKKKSLELNDPKITARDYHTTLLVMAVKRFDFGYFHLSFRIGDGGMAIINANGGETRVLVPPDSADRTRFLTMSEEIDEAKVRARTFCGFADDFEAVVLATDGVTDPFFPSKASLRSPEEWLKFWNETLREGDGDNAGCPEIFDRRAAPEAKAKALRGWLDFWAEGHHDDRTIVIVN